jgi:uncharacterized membrane protein YidH (DUF202 family)
MDGSTSSVTKLIDLLPLIIISVIVIVGFFTWEVFTQHLAPFILLITSVLFGILLYSGDVNSYLRWKKATTGPVSDPFILPPGKTPELSTTNLVLIIGTGIIVLALGLLLGITSYKIGKNIGGTDTLTNVMNYIGYGFIIVGGIIIISLLWKALRPSSSSSDSSDEENKGNSTIFRIIGGFISSVIGIYLVVRSNNLKTAKSQIVTDNDGPATSIANTVLNIGIILQVIVLLGAV